jgi:hypothetical protein
MAQGEGDGPRMTLPHLQTVVLRSPPADIGPAGLTDDLRWIDALVQHHTGALRMGQWRKAWYPEAPIASVALRAGGDPDAMADLIAMGPAQIQAMRMMVTSMGSTSPTTPSTTACSPSIETIGFRSGHFGGAPANRKPPAGAGGSRVHDPLIRASGRTISPGYQPADS